MIDHTPMTGANATMYSEPNYRHSSQGVGPSIENFIRLILRSKTFLVGWIVLCLILAAIYINITAPVYTASGTLLLDPRRSATIASDTSSLASQVNLDNAQAESQLQVVRSERLLKKVFDDLSLQNNDELHPKTVSFRQRLQDGLFPHGADPADQDPNRKEREAAAAFQNFVSRVGARRIGQSYVIEVSYTSSSPTEARRLANAVLSAFLGQQISYKLAAAQNGAEYLQGRINSLNNQLKAADQAIAEGRVPNNYMPDADARIIGAASEPLGRAWPKSGLIMAAAVSFGIFTGVLFVIVLASLDKKIRSSSQIEELLGLKVIECGISKDLRADLLKLAKELNNDRADQVQKIMIDTSIRKLTTEVELAIAHRAHWSVGFVSCSQNFLAPFMVESFYNIKRRHSGLVILIDLFDNMREHFIAGIRGGRPILSNAEELDRSVGFHVEPFPIEGGGGYVSGAEIRKPHDTTDMPLNVAPIIIEKVNQVASVIVDLGHADAGTGYLAAIGAVDHVFIVCESGKTTIGELSEVRRNILRRNARSDIHVILFSRQ
ncbi:Wzz/FepE/Etk N-terminal domain-containing protein [Methylobacterium sp. E-005]|uniref:Wzz/FepE/Etk N-terminal domain-containing protein n=1 Tax=Methylobacterium sp. E-005 TaxID=2836549 RepID=UPI001FB8B952|nr:Wzz/FepE/Etk N-terminal domain-containing protein [Methylobacterium sp. E-005]MCJ2084427.1 Wzz/FepE/Etk N-terminal domain-containing protein [Methylobacterium sp. E-005]